MDIFCRSHELPKVGTIRQTRSVPEALRLTFSAKIGPRGGGSIRKASQFTGVDQGEMIAEQEFSSAGNGGEFKGMPLNNEITAAIPNMEYHRNPAYSLA